MNYSKFSLIAITLIICSIILLISAYFLISPTFMLLLILPVFPTIYGSSIILYYNYIEKKYGYIPERIDMRIRIISGILVLISIIVFVILIIFLCFF